MIDGCVWRGGMQCVRRDERWGVEIGMPRSRCGEGWVDARWTSDGR